jgi:lysophospholipase L1-like esterase
MSSPRDDSLMSRFDEGGARRYRARDAVLIVLVAAMLLGLFEGRSVLRAGEQRAGIGGAIIRGVGRPFASVSGTLYLGPIATSVTRFLSPDQSLGSSGGGFTGGVGASSAAAAIPAVTAQAFDPTTLGLPAPAKRRLHTLLVTGDSMSQPLDADLAQRLVPRGVRVIQDPHIGTGISNSQILDWGKLSASQVRSAHPDAVVVFIGAAEGWPMAGEGRRQVECCSEEWAVIYAQRVRLLANTYRQVGAARVYWITLPDPRETAREKIARVVNAAIAVGVQPWASEVRVIDSVPIFTPTGYRDSMSLGGVQTIVREPDGIHLNEAGSRLLAGYVLDRLSGDFSY